MCFGWWPSLQRCCTALKAVPFPSRGVEETVVSVAPFPCLHEAVTQELGHSCCCCCCFKLMCYKLVKNNHAAFSPSLIIHHLKSLGDRSHWFSSESTVCQGHLSLSLFSILSLGNAEYIGFSMSPAGNLAQQKPSAYERRDGRFSVNCPGNREILAVLLGMLTVDCTLFHIEYLPAITSFFYTF